MVKSVIYTLTAIVLCVVLFVCVELYVDKQFDEFSSAVNTLYKKVENETANREDGYAVKEMWLDKKSKLHVFVPHNDISYVDYWLNETCGLIYTGDYEAALSKLEVLKEIADALPGSYAVRLENIF
ncbi:MAG: DUF4363 family protein [Clostridia bacterium]|nr:DUF4363 family protein [Clostridia bacterium]